MYRTAASLPRANNLTPYAFSCLLPVYHRDRPADLRAAFNSIRASTLAPFEVIVCEDGELTPALYAEIESVQSLPLRRVRNTGTPGLHHNLNAALPYVRTPWIARCDADDINHPDRFRRQIDYLVEHPEIDVLGCDIVEFDPDGRTCAKMMPSAPADVLRWAIARNPINHMTVFIRTEALLAGGGYPDVPHKEDYALWVKLLAQGRTLANLPSALVDARMGEDFYARRGGWKNLRSEWEIMKLKLQVPAMPPLLTVAYFFLRTCLLVVGPQLLGSVYRTFLRRPR